MWLVADDPGGVLTSDVSLGEGSGRCPASETGQQDIRGYNVERFHLKGPMNCWLYLVVHLIGVPASASRRTSISHGLSKYKYCTTHLSVEI